MSALQKRSEALPSIEKARSLLVQCRSIQEVMRIKALSQAVASCAASEEAKNEALAIMLLSKARAGELTAAMKQAPRGGAGGTKSSLREQKKTGALADEGISRKDAAEYEKLAGLKASGDLERIISASKTPVSTSGALALARLAPPQRTKAIAKLGEDGDFRKAIGEVKLQAKRTLAEEIRKNPVVTPDGRFQVIVSDPPWKYDSRADDTSHRGKNLYPDMTVPEICALPVASLAQENCVLWLWTTNAFMRGAYECLDAWGFREKTILTWDKEFLGLGDWLRNGTEHCVLAVRGRPVVSLTNQTTIIREKRRQHSRKPEAFYSLVESLCPGSKVEMFSRTNRKGWTAWGAEQGKYDDA